MTTMTTTKQAILKAALPRVRAHSFTLTAIRGGITDHPEAGSKDLDPDRLVDDIFGSKGEAEKELVRYWEEEGIRRISAQGRAGQGETLRDVLGRRLGFSEESAGEGVVQAHAIIQSPPVRPFALNLPEAMGRIVDKMRAREGGGWEAYLPPGEGGSEEAKEEVGGKMGGTSAGSISSETPLASSSTIDPYTNTKPNSATANPPHHLPFPLPPNLFKSIAYAWKIADEALHLSAAPFALNDADADAGADGVGGMGGMGGMGASKRDGGKDEVLRMGRGQGWEWYVRRGVVAGIYLRAESELMRPRPSTQPLTLPLERAMSKLDVLLEGSYESTVRRISLGGSGMELGAGELGGSGTRRWEEVGTLGRFVWKSWGGLFRSRGWIG